MKFKIALNYTLRPKIKQLGNDRVDEFHELCKFVCHGLMVMSQNIRLLGL